MGFNNVQLRMQQSFQEHVSDHLLLDCMRCGFCLPHCPTYLHMEQDETQSPRGRIALMLAVRDGVVAWDSSIEESFNLCLGCRACEPACPAGVQYGSLIEQTREAVQQVKQVSIFEKTVRKIVFNNVFKDQEKMSHAVSLVKFYQKSGLQTVVRKVGFLNLFPKHLKAMEASLPPIAKKVKPLAPVQTSKVKVAFFVGCLMDTLYKETNEKTIALLKMLGVEVTIPDDQQCCGALHGHSGELERGKSNLQRNIDVFDSDEYDYIVNNAGGCGAFLKEYEKHLSSEKAQRFSQRIIDISSLLVRVGILQMLKQLPITESQLTVTYQDSCHLRNVNNVINEPRLILKNLPGVTYKELPKADMCCGSAGIYNILQPQLAGEILTTKMNYVREVNPAVIVTANPGCLLQMESGIHRENLQDKVRAVHIVDFIYEKVKNNN